MKFNYLTIKKENGEELKFHPNSIMDIKIGQCYVMIWEMEDFQPMIATHILQSDYLYVNWTCFLNQINTFFDLGEK